MLATPEWIAITGMPAFRGKNGPFWKTMVDLIRDITGGRDYLRKGELRYSQ